ncbi:MAG: response regulator transcription factor [Thermomicrobiales bacterium]
MSTLPHVAGGRILIVDDEPQIRRALRTTLTAHGFEVETAEDGDDALVRIATWTPDAIVLDLVMPGKDGFEVLRDTRTWSQVPIVVLSARGQESDKVHALDMGADDYLTKPFGIQELLARLRAVMRRAAPPTESVFTAGTVTVDVSRHEVMRDGQPIHLTPTEFDLLRVLVTNAGRVLTHRQLLEQVWGGYAAENAPQLRVYVNYLRRKLEEDPAHPRLIGTEPGIGYRLQV